LSTIAKKKEKYENLATKSARGEYELVDPLDYMILDKLQDEGTTMGGYYPLADSVPGLRKAHFSDLPNTVVSARLRVMHIQGLVLQVKTVGSKMGWQRTEAGKGVVEAWRQR
jgi:hypothetical protein